MNYCKDCKYCPADFGNCTHPGNYYASPMAVGESMSFGVMTQRTGVVLLGSQCGVAGIWFSPKAPPVPEYRPLVMGEIVPKGAEFQYLGFWLSFSDSVGKPFDGKTADGCTIISTRCPANLKPVFPKPEIKPCKCCGSTSRIYEGPPPFRICDNMDCRVCGPFSSDPDAAWNKLMS